MGIKVLSNRHLRIFDLIPPGKEEYIKMDIGKKSEIMASLGFNTEHDEVMDVSQGASDTFYFNSGYGKTSKDMLSDIIEHNRMNNIGNIVYFNCHWAAKTLADKHPEWMQRTADGQIIKAGYGDGAFICINSSFKDWSMNVIGDLAKYNIDGIFLDGPYTHEKGCFCDACKTAFMGIYGYCLDENVFKEKRKLRDYMRFKSNAIAGYLKKCNETLKRIKPDSLIYMNSITVTASKYCSRDNNLTIQYQDILGAEGGFLYGDLRETSILKPGITAKYIETQSCGKPTVVFIAGRWSDWKRNLLTAAEHWILFAEAAANGANIWYGIYAENSSDEIMNDVRKINGFIEKNEKYYVGSHSLAQTAVVWSGKTANFYQTTVSKTDYTEEVEKLQDEMKSDARADFIGWCEMLSRNHILFDVIDDFAVENKDISKYNTLILPNVSCMSENEAENIRQFVEKGGNIITSYDTSFYDEVGEYTGDLQLKDVLGVLTVAGCENLKGNHIKVVKDSITSGVIQSFMPAPIHCLMVKPAGGAAACMVYKKKQPSVYSDIMPDTEYPFMIINGRGKGKSVYFTGNVGYMYSKYQIPEYKHIVKNVLGICNGMQVEIPDGPDSIDLVYRGCRDAKILHVINYTGTMTRPIEKVLVLKEIKVRIYDTGIEKIYDTKRETILDIKHFNGYVEFILPEILEYEVYVVT